MSAILATFFIAIIFFSFFIGIVPNGRTTVLSQIALTIFGGHGLGFYLLQLSTAMILAVAANTGFSTFPILAFNMAKDKYMPHAFMDRGDRLGYSNGIISLAIGAIVLIVIFHGQTNNLIPLYAVGVFVPFTLSQSGMIIHWFRTRQGIWPAKAFINFVGAVISFCLVAFLFWQHFNNVWPYLIIMPLLLYMFHRIHSHYIKVAAQLRVAEKTKVQLHDYDGATVIVLVGNVTRVTRGQSTTPGQLVTMSLPCTSRLMRTRGRSIRPPTSLRQNIPTFVLWISTPHTGRLPSQHCGLSMSLLSGRRPGTIQPRFWFPSLFLSTHGNWHCTTRPVFACGQC